MCVAADDILKKILGVVLKIRYDVESLAQQQHQMDQRILEKVLHLKDSQYYSGVDDTKNEDEYDSYLPITDEDSLNDFEQKLASRPFRLNTVSYAFK